jgi:hypothetical protein
VRRTWGLISCGLWEKFNGRLWKRCNFFYRFPYGEPKSFSKSGFSHYAFWARNCTSYVFLFCIT